MSSGRLEAFGVPCHGFSCSRQRECHTVLHCHTVVKCGTLCHTVVHCSTLSYTVVHYGTLWNTVVHCGTLWYTTKSKVPQSQSPHKSSRGSSMLKCVYLGIAQMTRELKPLPEWFVYSSIHIVSPIFTNFCQPTLPKFIPKVKIVV